MTEKVWVSSRYTTAAARRYHTDPECRFVDRMIRPVDRHLEYLPDGFEECRLCESGELPKGGRKNPRRFTNALEKAKPEELGLSPIGGRI